MELGESVDLCCLIIVFKDMFFFVFFGQGKDGEQFSSFVNWVVYYYLCGVWEELCKLQLNVKLGVSFGGYLWELKVIF